MSLDLIGVGQQRWLPCGKAASWIQLNARVPVMPTCSGRGKQRSTQSSRDKRKLCPVIEPDVTLLVKNAPFDISKMTLHHFRILLSRVSPPTVDPIEIVESPESPIDSPHVNHIPDPELDELSLFIVTPKLIHVAAWTIQPGLDFRGSAYRPKCGARIVPGSQVSEELPQAVRMCKRKAWLAALHVLE